MPLDQSSAYILGSVFCPFWGNEEELRGSKMQKLHQILVHFFLGGGGHVDYKTGLKLRLLANMLAANQSNATYIYIYIY